MFHPSRDEARAFLTETWRKAGAGERLSALEQMVLEVLTLHPEYHRIIEQPEAYAERDYRPEAGETNPFLHLQLHLAVEEQLSIDQPIGIRRAFEGLRTKLGDEHAARHAVLDCLGEVLWQAQRTGTGPDSRLYLQLLEDRTAMTVRR